MLEKIQIRDGDETYKRLINALSKENLEIIGGAYLFFIALGETGTESVLIKALNKYGDQDMAFNFKLSKNSKLDKAAGVWMKANGYSMLMGTFLSSGWGKRP
jgi:hypothetical protein